MVTVTLALSTLRSTLPHSPVSPKLTTYRKLICIGVRPSHGPQHPRLLCQDFLILSAASIGVTCLTAPFPE